MKEQDYILKKHVRARSVADAIALDSQTPVHEAFMIADKPDRESNTNAVGFQYVYPDEDI
jgi:hypothetical protein